MKLSSLSPDQRRVLLCEAAGWKRGTTTRAYGGSSMMKSPHGWTDPDGREHPLTPDYDTDLNACADLEVRLTDEQHNRFRKHLRAVVIGTIGYMWSDRTRRAYLSASAAQRCDALLLTLVEGMEL